jgi:hypothetical protein
MISTTKLGEFMGWTSKETFDQLVESGLIKKLDGDWVPTDRGIAEGAKMVDHPKYGTQLRWHPKTDLRKVTSKAAKDLLSGGLYFQDSISGR